MSYLHHLSLSACIQARLGLGLIQSGFFPPKISLSRYSHPGGILYRCPLLLNQKGDQFYPYFMSPHWPPPTVSRDAQGWLEFFFSQGELIAWLNTLPALLTLYYPYQEPPRPREEFFFTLQRACARCYSLLRSGEREKIIETSGDYRGFPGSDGTIHWELCIEKDYGKKLLLWIVRSMDEWNDTAPLTLAQGLAEAFIQYQRHEFRLRDNEEKVRAGLGLIGIVHHLLKTLLATKLAVLPLTSL